jgi:hypothetical protein
MEDESVRYLTLQFLDWIAARPRSYADVMEAWRTSCPRLPVWEDAISRGLVKRESGPSLMHAMVSITPAGREALQTAHPAPRQAAPASASASAFGQGERACGHG